jgi:hypothetical protein
MSKPKKIFFGLAVISLCAFGMYAYNLFFAAPNFAGGQPPTYCTSEHAAHDCKTLNCTTHVWYCDRTGVAMCQKNSCTCQYTCL